MKLGARWGDRTPVEVRELVAGDGRVLADALEGGRRGGEHEVRGGGVVPGPHHFDQAGSGEVVGVSDAFEVGIEGLASGEVNESRQAGIDGVSPHLDSPRWHRLARRMPRPSQGR